MKALALGACLVLTGCNTERTLHQLGIPGVTSEFRVTRLVERGEYLEATLSGGAGTLRLYVPPSEACRGVLAPEASVAYAAEGAGRVTREGEGCDAAGIGPVDELRRRRGDPTSLTTSAIPREQASYRVVYEDEEFTFLRGRFPLAGLVGWSGGEDTIAVVSNAPECRAVAGRSTSSLEFRPRGGNTLTLVSQPQPCLIEGLIRPAR
jgi:hypothetical protein